MCKVQMLRALVKQRLTAAAEEIFGLFERTIAEYEEEVCRLREDNERQQKLLDAVFNPQLRLHRADNQQQSEVKEEVPPEQQDQEDQEDQEDPEPPHIEEDQEDPEPPHIKEEQEELWTSQEEEQLQGLEEADITKFTITSVPVKSEDEDEEKPQSSQLHHRQTEQMETEADGEDCGGPEPDPDPHSQPEPQSASNLQKHDDVPVSNSRCSAGEKPFGCSECGKRFATSGNLKQHVKSHTGEKPFSCSFCGKAFTWRGNLQTHMRIHTGEKPFSCLACGKNFRQNGELTRHMAVHTGEKRYSCGVCHKRFAWRHNVKRHKCVGRPSSQLHHSEAEEVREAAAGGSTRHTETEAGGPEPGRDSDPDCLIVG